MNTKFWSTPTPKESEQAREIIRLRRENRYKMWTATKRLSQWALMAVGAAAIYNKVVDNDPEEETEV